MPLFLESKKAEHLCSAFFSLGLVAGVVLRYSATQLFTFELPGSVYAKYALVGV